MPAPEDKTKKEIWKKNLSQSLKGNKNGFIKGQMRKRVKEWYREGREMGFKRGHKINNGRQRFGKDNGIYNKHHTRGTKKKISKSLIGNKNALGSRWKHKKESVDKISGKNSPHWKGGISFDPYSMDWTRTLKRFIRERDSYTCRLCSRYGNIVHHIDYDKKNCNPNNLIVLCRVCNSKVNFNRGYWLDYLYKDIKSEAKKEESMSIRGGW